MNETKGTTRKNSTAIYVATTTKTIDVPGALFSIITKTIDKIHHTEN